MKELPMKRGGFHCGKEKKVMRHLGRFRFHAVNLFRRGRKDPITGGGSTGRRLFLLGPPYRDPKTHSRGLKAGLGRSAFHQ